MHAEREENRKQRRHAFDVEGDARKRRDPDFAELHRANEFRVLVPVGERAGSRRETDERQDEQSGREVDVDAGIAGANQGAEGEMNTCLNRLWLNTPRSCVANSGPSRLVASRENWEAGAGGGSADCGA